MSITNKIINFISFLLHGKPSPIVAHIAYLQPSNLLIGKKIIITGGSRGIGFSMAKKFCAEGAEVIITGRNEKLLQDVSQHIGCKYLMLDLQDSHSFKKFIEQADELLGGINVLVNNAGISLHEPGFLDVTQESFDAQFNTNLKGSFFLTQCFIEYCKSRQISGFKKILFISSETGNTADERPYGLTKAALNSLVAGLAYRYVKEGYRINALAPGVTISDMSGKKNDGILGFGNGNRYFLPEEMAEVATFLISDVSNCMTGQILVCNEGKTINARWK